MYTTKEAAEKLSVSQNEVRYLLGKGLLKGKKSGHSWIVLDLNNYQKQRSPKIKGGKAKISLEQLELLKLLQNGWRLHNYIDFKLHHWASTPTHASGIVEIESPMEK